MRWRIIYLLRFDLFHGKTEYSSDSLNVNILMIMFKLLCSQSKWLHIWVIGPSFRCICAVSVGQALCVYCRKWSIALFSYGIAQWFHSSICTTESLVGYHFLLDYSVTQYFSRFESFLTMSVGVNFLLK